MKRSLIPFLVALTLFIVSATNAQKPPAVQIVKGSDERFKTDILVVVAHPDDEGGVTPYLARAIYDQHKRVAVVFATRGGSGGNDYSREHGPALADVREQEARQACAAIGITNVWFLDGKDTASQNVLNSLANWSHGTNLEALVRIVRLTRPEAIISWLPGIFIGENHGDHQAAGVLATEAFDLAADAAAFPAQVAGASKRLEIYLENLTPWQPKKLYFFSDAADQKQFAGSGPSYSVREVSPSQRRPYWRIAMDAAKPHLTQFPEDIHRISAMSDEQITKFMEDPEHMWWTEPMTLIFGKAMFATKVTDDVFSEGQRQEKPVERARMKGTAVVSVELAGPWQYYREFRERHGLTDLPQPKLNEIELKTGSTLNVPIMVTHSPDKNVEVDVTVDAPKGWSVLSGAGRLLLPAESKTALTVAMSMPDLSKGELKTAEPAEVVVNVSVEGTQSQVRLRVLLKSSALPQ
jgi:LmbE family N-acetylglucosaminyl deacetylase